MSLTCKLCGKPVQALKSFRCRSCRMLVCGECVNRRLESGGVVCADCASHGRKAPEEAEKELRKASAGKKSPFKIPNPLRGIDMLTRRSRVMIFASLLLLVFVAVWLYPLTRVSELCEKLSSTDDEIALSAEIELINMGGAVVYSKMQDMILEGSGKSRIRALRIIGELGRADAIPFLRRIMEDPHEPPAVRAAAREAVVQIENY